MVSEVAQVAGGRTGRGRKEARKAAGGTETWTGVGRSTGAAPGPSFPDLAPRGRVLAPRDSAVRTCRDAKRLDAPNDRGNGGATRVELPLNP